MFGGLFRSSSAPPAAPVSKPVSGLEESSCSAPSSSRPAHYRPLRRYRRQNRQSQQRSLAPSSQLSAASSNDSTIDRRNLSRPSTVKNSGVVFVDSHLTADGNNSNAMSTDQPRNPAIWNRRYFHHHKQPSSKSLTLPPKQQQQEQQQRKTKQQRRRLRTSSILSLPSSLPGQNHHSSSSFSCSSSSPVMAANAAATTTKQPSVFFLAGHASSKLQREESYRHGLEILSQMGRTTNDAMRRHRGEMMEHDLDILSGLTTQSTSNTTTTTTTTSMMIGDNDDENRSYDEYFMSLAGGSTSAVGTVVSTTSSLKRDSSLSL